MRLPVLVLAGLLLAAPTALAQVWREYNGYEYYWNKDNGVANMNWFNARQHCLGLGAGTDLTSLRDPDEVAFVFSINPDRTKVRWVGGFRNRTDDGDVQPFTFYWVNGDPFDIEDYYVGCTPDVDCFWEGGPAGNPDPNDLNNVEDCIAMGHRTDALNDGAMNDENCFLVYQFVCRREIPTCPQVIPTLDENASATCASAAVDRREGATCNATCEVGYTSSGSGEYVCSATGEWTGGNLVCTPVDCGSSIPGLTNAVAVCTDTTFGSTCLASCARGFGEQSPSDSSYVCGADGNWADGDINCAIDCGPLFGLPNAVADCGTATLEGDSCTASCVSPFTEQPGSDPTYLCSSSGVWTNGNIICTTPSPTPLPTSSPTSSPTTSPSPGPTPRPTTTPTPAPSPAPTTSPSPAPTTSPTGVPTRGPTAPPTAGPTRRPTTSPTPSPTDSPTRSPTPGPTARPTAGPTAHPTPVPTDGPTSSPTSSPTFSPTASPTSSPTRSPTESPTPAPTAAPSPSPTATPTAPPSPHPSPHPTHRPTTAAPTGSPTPSPTPTPPCPTTIPGLSSRINADCTGSNAHGSICNVSCVNGADTKIGQDQFICVAGTWFGGCGLTCTNWAVREDREYYFSALQGGFQTNFASARLNCLAKGQGSDLASIHSRDELVYISSLDPKGVSRPKWLGIIRDRNLDQNGAIRPLVFNHTDGTPFDIVEPGQQDIAGCTVNVDCIWSGGAFGNEPSSFSPQGLAENCVQLGHNSEAVVPSLNDAVCTLDRHYVCARDLDRPASCPSLESYLGPGSPTTTPTAVPTFSPTTPSPSTSPTASPTRGPTTSPTAAPTSPPTHSPTTSPTDHPTVSPTTAPSPAPTTSPSPVPTHAPVIGPTTSPTTAPSNSPTTSPTAAPTGSPTPAPSSSPSTAPTSHPTGVPTTPSPTTTPTTPGPTTSPTPGPTSLSTPSPTAAPRCPATIPSGSLPLNAVSTSCISTTVGTICNATCGSGYKIVGDRRFICDFQGTWQGGCAFACAPSSWTVRGTNQYYVSSTQPNNFRVNYATAASKCRALQPGSTLASFPDAATAAAIHRLDPKQPTRGLFIGGMRNRSAPGFTFYWTNGQPFKNNIPFIANNPDDLGGVEHNLAVGNPIATAAGQLNDIRPTLNRHYICGVVGVDPATCPSLQSYLRPPAPTQAPTGRPTTTPTRAPTGVPTTAPTAHPTGTPTTAPSPAPTDAPTPRPSSGPTTPVPTGSPTTPGPTTSPTLAPSGTPTTTPTAHPTTPSPTAHPTTPSPTSPPSPAPTTPAPTTAPSPAPTGNPTSSPTDAPTDAPTDSPTRAPTSSCGPLDSSVLPTGATANCEDTSQGAYCNASCVVGTQLGDSLYVCGADGEWHGGCAFSCSTWRIFQDQSEYLFSAGPEAGGELFRTTWEAARLTCEAFGAHLATFSSRAEIEFAARLDEAKGSSRPKWIGGRRNFSQPLSPTSFYWITGEPFDLPTSAEYASCTSGVNCFWQAGEPNNLGGGTTEDVLQIGHVDEVPAAASVNDAASTLDRHYICERDIVSVAEANCPDLQSFLPAPTTAPTREPTGTPTTAPTGAPTSTPTNSPTGTPTTTPTGAPTGTPTPAPTGTPTTTPTGAPTGTPTAAPSGTPTTAPSDSPTAAPTVRPRIPTVSPTPAPTSLSPTSAPTELTPSPTFSPITPGPTFSPTPVPSTAPSASPTTSPTTTPTRDPTASPSAAPTPSGTPSPTSAPTPAPTLNCGPLDTSSGLPANAEASCSSTAFGSICTATCGAGAPNQLGDGDYICGADGEWHGGCNFRCTTWDVFEETEYYFSATHGEPSLDFRAAEARCVQLGGHLASVHNTAENLFLHNLDPKGITRPKWLGGERDTSAGAPPATFFWLDGTPFDFQNWKSGEPSLDRETAIAMGNAAAVLPGVWNDALDSRVWPFYCKRAVEQVTCPDFSIYLVVPTASPTTSPTGVPTTPSPTATPTTAKPTTSPTATPTGSPTTAPTRVPTTAPTPVPTPIPTIGAPTPTPTRAPTAQPSVGLCGASQQIARSDTSDGFQASQDRRCSSVFDDAQRISSITTGRRFTDLATFSTECLCECDFVGCSHYVIIQGKSAFVCHTLRSCGSIVATQTFTSYSFVKVI